jgi:hypothetical protein
MSEAISADREACGEARSHSTSRYGRCLSDKILIAFHYACDQSDFEVARQLLYNLEMILTHQSLIPDGIRHRDVEGLVAAHERLWHLRRPNTDKY